MIPLATNAAAGVTHRGSAHGLARVQLAVSELGIARVAKEMCMIEWFDDVRVGMRFKSPEKLVTREDIKRFAAEFDPQPYHLDEVAAARSPLKGLAASGWHTAAMAMRLALEARPFGPHPLLGLGVDELRWLAPVRPGDVIHLEGEVTDVTTSRTRAQGIVRVKWTAFNQDGTAVYTFTPIGIVPRRPTA